MRLSPLFYAFVRFVCGVVFCAQPVWSAPAEPDWGAVQGEVTALLSAYLQVPSINPPGNESLAAAFLAERLAAEGIEAEIIESAPGRGNLIARLKGATDAPALCLLSHLDVVPAEAERWPADRAPFAGVIDDEGWIWGRGALDMKGLTAAELQVFLLLARQKVPLQRDVVLVAVADEEVDNTGARFLLEKHWDKLGCGDVINEGGIGVYDLFFPGQTAFAISVGEKGVLWLKMIAEGEPGHGSTPRPNESPQRLQRALSRLEDRRARLHFHATFLESLRRAGEHAGGVAGWVMQRPFWARLLLKSRIAKNPISLAGVTDTVHLTGMGGAMSPNVVPSESWAHLDCRLLPGTSSAELLTELKALVDDPKVRFEILSDDAAASSPWRGEAVFEALAKYSVQGLDDAVAVPVLSVGFTDSVFFRQRGVRAYGLVPFRVNSDLLKTMHGDGERLASSELLRGVQVLYRTVVDVTGL